MKKMTPFFTIAILVCITTFVVFASNQNRDRSYAYLIVAQPPDNDLIPSGISDKSCEGADSEGDLWSTASSWFGYYLRDGELLCGASAYAYVSCYSSNSSYETSYDLYAEVPDGFQYPNVRDPETQTGYGSFYDSEYRSGEANGMLYSMGGSTPNGSVSATGTNPSSNETHNTSAASPTPSTARDFEIICDACDDYGCSLCNSYR